MASLAPDVRWKFAQRLKSLRLERGFERARFFAKALGIEENRYTRYERAEVEPNLTLIAKMCETLRVTPNQLLGLAEDERGVHQLPGPGFAERAQEPAHGGRQGRDLLAWRLASEVIAVHRDLGTKSNARSDPLESMRDIGTLYRHLQSDPFGTVAEILQKPELEEIDADRKAALAELIQAYTRSVA
jgi:transcriptional regulator with XRE-family HTH domain